MLEAIIFDMDGLMIDSQPFWQSAQLEVLPRYGVPITRQDTIDTTGMRIDDILRHCFATSTDGNDQTTSEHHVDEAAISDEILQRVVDLVIETKPAMPGLGHAIEIGQSLGIPLAVASSSSMQLIEATVDALDLEGIFSVMVSGSVLEHAKPHPEVYLNACDALGVGPQNSLALEDSFVGLLSAKAAGMKTIVVPEASAAADKRFVIADRKLASLLELSRELLMSL